MAFTVATSITLPIALADRVRIYADSYHDGVTSRAITALIDDAFNGPRVEQMDDSTLQALFVAVKLEMNERADKAKIDAEKATQTNETTPSTG